MSKKGAKLTAQAKRIALVREYVERYLLFLRELVLADPKFDPTAIRTAMAAVGKAEIWPCTDGAVVLVYAQVYCQVDIVVQNAQNLSLNDFFKHPISIPD